MTNTDSASGLTQRTVYALQSNGERQRFPDHKVKGLVLRIAPGGTKTFVLRYRKKDGTSSEMNLGRADSIPLDLARERARVALTRISGGGDPLDDRRDEKLEAERQKYRSLRALAERWQNTARFQALKPRTRDYYLTVLRRDILPKLGDTPDDQIRRRDIAEMLDRVFIEVSGPTSNSARRTLSALMTYAIEMELLEYNPVSAVRARHRNGQRTRQLSDDELRGLWTALDEKECMGSDVSDMTRLSLFLPARINELAGAEWREIDFGTNVWTFPPERMKNKKPHELPFGPAARAVLQARRNGESGNSRWVFPAQSGTEPMNGKVASRACNRLSYQLGWPPFGPHALRRTFASRMAAQGTSIELLERCLSHDVTHGRAIAHYAHYSYREEKRGVTSFGKRRS